MRIGVVVMAVAIVLFGVRSAGADVLIEGTKFISASIVLNSATYEPYAETQHVIVKGDTLSGIAKAVYGDAARAAEIQKANPKIDPLNLEIGKAIVLPAKKSPPADAKTPLAFEFYLVASIHHGDLPERVFFGVPFSAPKYGGVLFAVPPQSRGEFLRAFKEGKGQVEPLKKIDGVLAFDGISGANTADSTSTAVRSVTFYEVAPPKKAGELLDVKHTKTEYADAQGKAAKAGFDGVAVLVLAGIAIAGAIALRKRTA